MEFKNWLRFSLILGFFILMTQTLTAIQLSFSETANHYELQHSEMVKAPQLKNKYTKLSQGVLPTQRPSSFLKDRFAVKLFFKFESKGVGQNQSFYLMDEKQEWGLHSAHHAVSDIELQENMVLLIGDTIENDHDFLENPVEPAAEEDESDRLTPATIEISIAQDSELVEEESDEIESDITGFDFQGLNLSLDFTADHLDDLCYKKNTAVQIPIESNDVNPIDQKLIPGIKVYSNKKVKAFIHLYTVKKRDVFIKALERMPTYKPMISRILHEYELPQNLIYLAVVESNLNPDARSPANALGLWQFMSYTGKYYGLSRSWWHDDRYDPEMSTIAAAKYLKRLNKQFKGNWELALAAYNSGGGTVRRAIRKAKAKGHSTDFWSLRLPRETRGYLPAFFAVSTIFENLEKYGFGPVGISLAKPPKRLLKVGGGISLKQMASVLNADHKLLAAINPRLRFKGLTPPTLNLFEIAVPASLEINPQQIQELEKLKENRHTQWKVHKIEQGDTLWSISRHFQIPISQILDYNRLRRKSILRIGQKLMLPIPSDWVRPKTASKTELAKSDVQSIPGVTIVHIVKKGETLWQISQKYSVSIAKIKRWNRRVLRRKYLKVGTEIVLKVPVELASNISL